MLGKEYLYVDKHMVINLTNERLLLSKFFANQ